MRALVIDRPGSIVLEDVEQPDAGGECLVRVRLAGICGTDLELLRGYADFAGIPGHEFVGVVERAPGSAAFLVGRRVVGEINIGCGTCRFCRADVKEHCEQRTVLGIRGRPGAFAEYLTLPAGNLHSVPTAIEDDRAVFVEPVAAACRILEQVHLTSSTRTAIVGDGRMALLTAQVLRTRGATITVVGRHEEKLAVARTLGFEILGLGDADAESKRFDVVVDASGKPGGFERALALVRPRGTVVLKSTFHGELTWAPWPVVVDELTIVGSRCGPFEPALALLAAGTIDVRPLIAEIHPLEEYEAAFDAAVRSLKVLLRVSDE